MKNKKIGFTLVICLLLILITIGITYAAFQFVGVGGVENTLETGTVMLTYTEGKTGIILENALPISDDAGKILTGENNVFDFTVTATLGNQTPIGYEVSAIKIPITDMESLLDNEVKLYLERAIDPDTSYESIMEPTNFIPIDNMSEVGSPKGSMILDQGNFMEKGTTIHNYRLRLWVDENAEVGNTPKKYGVKINVYAKQGVMFDTRNKNISNIYTYNQTSGSSNFCVTGEEDTCLELTIAPTTYEVGTIVKYKVNDTEEKYFHVLSDNGDTLTLQQRENTVYKTPWYQDAADNTKGPLTILPVLEEATKNWDNVVNQTYQLGTTVIKDNFYTGCDDANKECTTNTYTLPERTAKARLITVQELSSLGCTSNGQCPVWVYNYLYNSTTFGGTVDQKGGEYGSNYAYWTSSANSSSTTNPWSFGSSGELTYYGSASLVAGARAVIIINK